MNIRFTRIFLFSLAAFFANADLCATFDPHAITQGITHGLGHVQHIVDAGIDAKRTAFSTLKNGYNSVTGMLSPRIAYPLFWGDLDRSFKRLCKGHPHLKIQAEPLFDALKALIYAENIPGSRTNDLVLIARHLRRGLEDIRDFVHNDGEFPVLYSESLEYCLRAIAGNNFDRLVKNFLGMLANPLGLNTDEGRAALFEACNGGRPLSFIFQHLIACDPQFKKSFSLFLHNLDLNAIFNSDEKTASVALRNFAQGLTQLTLPNQPIVISSVANALIYHPAVHDRIPFLARLGIDFALQALIAPITAAWGKLIDGLNHTKNVIAELIPYAYDPNAREEYPNMVRCYYAARRGETFNVILPPKPHEAYAGPFNKGEDHVSPVDEIIVPQGMAQGPFNRKEVVKEDGSVEYVETFFEHNTEEAFIAQYRVDAPMKCFFARLEVLFDHFWWRMRGTPPAPKEHNFVRAYNFISSGGPARIMQQLQAQVTEAAENGIVEGILSLLFGDQKDFILGRTVPPRPDIHQVPLESDDQMTQMINQAMNGFTPFADGLQEEARKRSLTPEERAFEKQMKHDDADAEKEFTDELHASVEEILAKKEQDRNDALNERKRNNRILFHIPIPNTPLGVGIHVRDVVHAALGLVNAGLYKKFYTDVRDLRLERLTKKVITDRDRILRLLKDIDGRARGKLARYINPRENSLVDIYRAISSGKITRDDLSLPDWLVDKRPVKTWRDKWNEFRGRKRKLDRFDTKPIDNLREYLDDNLAVMSLNPLQKDMAFIVAKKLALEKGVELLAEASMGGSVLSPEAIYSYERGPGGVLQPVQWTNPENGKTYNKIILSPYGGSKALNYLSKLLPASLVGASFDRARLSRFMQAGQNLDRAQIKAELERTADNINAAVEKLVVVDAVPAVQEGYEQLRKVAAEIRDPEKFINDAMESEWADSGSDVSTVSVKDFIMGMIKGFVYGETEKPITKEKMREKQRTVIRDIEDADGTVRQNVSCQETELDEKGNPILEVVMEPVLGPDGQPLKDAEGASILRAVVEPVLDEHGKPKKITTPMGYVKKIGESITDSVVVQHATTYWMYIVAAHCYDKVAQKQLNIFIQKNIDEFEKLLTAHRTASRQGDPIALEDAEDAIKEFLRQSLRMVNLNALLGACLSKPAVIGANLLSGGVATRLAIMSAEKCIEEKSWLSGIAAAVCGWFAYKNGKNIFNTITDAI